MIQFIHHTGPGEVVSAASRRKAHSHAARTAHAKTRRLRTIEYQSAKVQRVVNDGETSTINTTVISNAQTSGDQDRYTHPSPLSLLTSDRRDPFHSFARRLRPLEHFLLDHCMSLDGLV
jgi:hypothetical protein